MAVKYGKILYWQVAPVATKRGYKCRLCEFCSDFWRYKRVPQISLNDSIVYVAFRNKLTFGGLKKCNTLARVEWVVET